MKTFTQLSALVVFFMVGNVWANCANGWGVGQSVTESCGEGGFTQTTTCIQNVSGGFSLSRGDCARNLLGPVSDGGVRPDSVPNRGSLVLQKAEVKSKTGVKCQVDLFEIANQVAECDGSECLVKISCEVASKDASEKK